jgi:hypothetical protein
MDDFYRRIVARPLAAKDGHFVSRLGKQTRMRRQHPLHAADNRGICIMEERETHGAALAQAVLCSQG